MRACARAATATSPIGSWRPCATSSAVTRSRARRPRPRRCPARTLRQAAARRPRPAGGAEAADVAVAAGRPTEQPQPENPLTAGLERLPVAPTTLVIFGATGDLARRKLLPALYNLAHDGALPERFPLVGISRKEKAHEDYREECEQAIR